ncbi:GrpB family protein [uncultured Tateyamaria sp.]|uniref:GrpB family protein n=1 Tax=uncultured Tateyamaria sp. TaxID=455651 RepID=UPI00261A99EA|nr:GrpB family protein [uncultured Tateyamaria sp.]
MPDTPPPLGLRQTALALTPYDPRWAALFEQEAARIRQVLAGLVFHIDHIGSTAVPGLQAKPIMDIAVRCDAQEDVANALTGIGYIDRGMRSGRLFIRLRDGDVRTHNLHLYQTDDADCRDQIAFRDALRSDPDLRDSYAKLKQQLVTNLGDAGRGHYAEGKTHFVRSVLARAR